MRSKGFVRVRSYYSRAPFGRQGRSVLLPGTLVLAGFIRVRSDISSSPRGLAFAARHGDRALGVVGLIRLRSVRPGDRLCSFSLFLCLQRTEMVRRTLRPPTRSGKHQSNSTTHRQPIGRTGKDRRTLRPPGHT